MALTTFDALRETECRMRAISLIVGLVLFILGLHWVGQGTGYFPWPRNPVMDNQIEWAYYGAGTALLGFIVIWLARRGAP
jgi:uncharacterized membrane protein